MALNPSIILAGQPVNALGSMQAGLSLAEQQNGVSQQNALANLYKTQGAGIANGDPAALNALAGFSPQAAVDIRGAQQGQAFDAEKMNQLRVEWKNKTTDRAAAMSEAERAAKAAEIERSVAAGLAAQTPEQWDQIVTGMGATDLVGQFDNRTAIAFSYMGVADALKAAQGPKPADEYQRYVQEETSAGRQPLSRIDFAQAKKGEGIVVTNADGSTIRVGGKSTGGGGGVKPGTAPQGFTLLDDPNAPGGVAMVATPGGPEAAAAEKAKKASALALSTFKNKAKIVDTKLTEAIASIEKNGQWVAGLGSYLQNIPNTEAIHFKGLLDTVKANLGFEELQSMRDNSPTGGALGQVSERELEFLQSVQTSLEQAQHPADLKKILVNLQVGRRKFQAEREAIMNSDTGESGAEITPESVYEKYKN